MTSAELVYYVMGAAVVAYALTSGADFGAGVWHLLARGPDADEERALITKTIAPIWEANHIWMILVVVLMFSAFPRAFAAIGIALHIPITIVLVGIVLRGSAFIFRSYGHAEWLTRPAGRVFSLASCLSPVALGLVVAAVGSGDIRWVEGQVRSGFFAGWTTLFALTVGLFALSLFTLLAAVYLTHAAGPELSPRFRRRVFVMELIAGVLALATFLLSKGAAPQLYSNLSQSAWTWPVQLTTAGAAAATVGATWVHKTGLARVTAGAQVGLVVIGWGLAMQGHLLLPDMPIHAAGARAELLALLLPVLAAGGLVTAPALLFLYRVFGQRES